nr:hypothetical protein [Stigmatella aurantiaca]
MQAQCLGQQDADVGERGDIPPLEQVLLREALPGPPYPSAPDAPSQEQRHPAGAMVRAKIAILTRGASKLAKAAQLRARSSSRCAKGPLPQPWRMWVSQPPVSVAAS